MLADRLSVLPLEILALILSRLKLKEAARTSVLSQKWTNLWTHTTGTLDFECLDKFGSTRRILGMSQRLIKISLKKGKLYQEEGPSFVDWVNGVLSLHQGVTIDGFEVSSKLRRNKKKVIDKWIEFALKKRVKWLKLDLEGKIPSWRNYSLKKQLLCKYNIDSLKSLYLKDVDVTGNVIEYILLKSHVLEVLCVECSNSLIKLKVPGPLPQLKRLEIKHCVNIKCLEIHAINIESFAYHGINIPVMFEKVPHLVEVSLGSDFASFFVANIGQFSSYISCLETLMLNISRLYDTYLGEDVAPELPVVENIRQLALDLHHFDVESVMNYCALWLQKCPMLRRLSLKVTLEFNQLISISHTRMIQVMRNYGAPFSSQVQGKPVTGGGTDWRIKREAKGLHNCLKVLELENVYGAEEEAAISCFLVTNIPSLEQVIVRPGLWANVNAFAKQLGKLIPPNANLIILP